MSPAIFIEDFERTEYSDYLHGVVGRSLIIATRFDSMCVSLSIAWNLKNLFHDPISREKDFDEFVAEVTFKYRNLNESIKSFKLPEELSTILYNSKNARNEIAHSLAKGLEGCVDSKINESDFSSHVKELVNSITDGDIIISLLVSAFNNEPTLNKESLNKYKERVLNWVIEQ